MKCFEGFANALCIEVEVAVYLWALVRLVWL
jgi:hypothetical protein